MTLPAVLPARVTLVRSLDQPNGKLVELLIAAAAARELGVRELILVAPYLCYMRQDIAFSPGEAVSQRIIGALLGERFDRVIAVDPHLHRIKDLGEAVPSGSCGDAIALSAAPAVGQFLRRSIQGECSGALLLGPDDESAQWVAEAARSADMPWGVCTKLRRGDRDVEVTLPALEISGRIVVLFDDIASSGHTLIEAARACLARGAHRVDVFVTHALFAAGALDALKAEGIGRIWSTDSVAHSSNSLELAPLIAAALRRT